ncbi:MAG: hypothetical protein QW304_01495 [Thermoproteota archaeon]
MRNSFLRTIWRVTLLKDVFFQDNQVRKLFPVSPSLFKAVEEVKWFISLFKALVLVKNMNWHSKEELLKSFVE